MSLSQRLLPGLIAIFASFWLLHCANPLATDNVAKDADLTAAIENEDSLKEEDIADGKSTSALAPGQTVVYYAPDPANKGWARTSWSVSSETRTVISTDEKAKTAQVKITRTISGSLQAASTWLNFKNDITVFKKNFTMTKTRYAEFTYDDTVKDKSKRWKLSKLSPAAAESDAATVKISKVTIYSTADAATPLLTLDDPTKLYTKADLPQLANNGTIRIDVTVSAPSGTVPLAFVHLAMFRIPLASTDNVTYSSKAIKLGAASLKHLHFDVIDKATIDSETAAYNSQVWHFVFAGK